ncbi:MAG: hypothetical protein OXH03_00555, partial [Bacteroidetes bacterium]|nr:hypothetical protein [Bacteroidota bacterium]MDE2671888.1 hypothetical protein [Bacteroidota bacterium]
VEVGEVLESELSHGRVHFTSVCRNIRKLRLCKSEHPLMILSEIGHTFRPNSRIMETTGFGGSSFEACLTLSGREPAG